MSRAENFAGWLSIGRTLHCILDRPCGLHRAHYSWRVLCSKLTIGTPDAVSVSDSRYRCDVITPVTELRGSLTQKKLGEGTFLSQGKNDCHCPFRSFRHCPFGTKFSSAICRCVTLYVVKTTDVPRYETFDSCVAFTFDLRSELLLGLHCLYYRSNAAGYPWLTDGNGNTSG